MRSSVFKRGVMNTIIRFFIYLVFVAASLAAGRAESQQADAKRGAQIGRFLQKDSIITYIVRDREKSEINLTMLIAHNSALESRIDKLTGQGLLPIVFSVSTVPHRSYVFDPTALIFEQHGKEWHLDTLTVEAHTIQLEATGKFGGLVKPGEIHQAVVLLPEWFNIEKPIKVHYDPNREARFKLTEAK